MKIYRRADGFEVQDAKNRDLAWVKESFGGEFTEIVEGKKDSKIVEQSMMLDERRKKAIEKLSKIGLTPQDIKDALL